MIFEIEIEFFPCDSYLKIKNTFKSTCTIQTGSCASIK